MVNGEERWGEGFYEERSPIDSEIVVGRYAQATEADVNDAVAAAKEYFPVWSTTPWPERVGIDAESRRRHGGTAVRSGGARRNRGW